MGSRSRAIFDYSYQVLMVDRETGDIVERLAEADHFDVAKAAFTAALGVRTRAVIELRNGARVVQTAET